MEFGYFICKDVKSVLVEEVGDYCFKSCEEYYSTILNDKTYKSDFNFLIDKRQVNLNTLSFGQSWALSLKVNRLLVQRMSVKVATVHSDSNYPNGRQLENMFDSMGANYRIFKNMPDAKQFLGISPRFDYHDC